MCFTAPRYYPGTGKLHETSLGTICENGSVLPISLPRASAGKKIGLPDTLGTWAM